MSLVNALPVALEERDVYAPTVLYPSTGDVWKVGSKYTVTWYDRCFSTGMIRSSISHHRDVSKPPTEITNKVGEIYLRQGDYTDLSSMSLSCFLCIVGD